MKRTIKRLLGRLSIIPYCFRHDQEYDMEHGYHHRVTCSKCDSEEMKTVTLFLFDGSKIKLEPGQSIPEEFRKYPREEANELVAAKTKEKDDTFKDCS